MAPFLRKRGMILKTQKTNKWKQCSVFPILTQAYERYTVTLFFFVSGINKRKPNSGKGSIAVIP